MADRSELEWMDIKALCAYACVSPRTARGWVGRAVNPLPASRVGGKLFVSRRQFDAWMEAQTFIPLGAVDVEDILARVLNCGEQTRAPKTQRTASVLPTSN